MRACRVQIATMFCDSLTEGACKSRSIFFVRVQCPHSGSRLQKQAQENVAKTSGATTSVSNCQEEHTFEPVYVLATLFLKRDSSFSPRSWSFFLFGRRRNVRKRIVSAKMRQNFARWDSNHTPRIRRGVCRVKQGLTGGRTGGGPVPPHSFPRCPSCVKLLVRFGSVVADRSRVFCFLC